MGILAEMDCEKRILIGIALTELKGVVKEVGMPQYCLADYEEALLHTNIEPSRLFQVGSSCYRNKICLK